MEIARCKDATFSVLLGSPEQQSGVPRRYSRPQELLIDPPSGPFATSRPICTCPCTLTGNCTQCLYYATSSHAVCRADAPITDHPPQSPAAFNWALATVQSMSPIAFSRPEVSGKRMHPNGPHGQVKSCLHTSSSLGRTNLTEIGSLSKSHYLLDLRILMGRRRPTTRDRYST
jgi:hypothetical protein